MFSQTQEEEKRDPNAVPRSPTCAPAEHFPQPDTVVGVSVTSQLLPQLFQPQLGRDGMGMLEL